MEKKQEWEREKHSWEPIVGCLPNASYWEPSLLLGYVHLLGIELVISQCRGWHSTNRAIPTRGRPLGVDGTWASHKHSYGGVVWFNSHRTSTWTDLVCPWWHSCPIVPLLLVIMMATLRSEFGNFCGDPLFQRGSQFAQDICHWARVSLSEDFSC